MGMLANRLAKNRKKFAKWAAQNGIESYRLYQQDIPEYPLIVDIYRDCAAIWANRRKRDETEADAQRFLQDVLSECCSGLGIPAERLFLKNRRPGGQYRKRDEQPYWLDINEHGLSFKVNLSSYHDTGLFLDHRPTRRWVRAQAAGRDMLNLFCYTGSFTVYSAAGGAASTTSVDLSSRYLDWLDDNLRANRLSGEHLLIQADVRLWLERAKAERRRFDIIVCDPPTFSNSKRTANLFDVTRDHSSLIKAAMELLRPGGWLLFSTNKRGFSLDAGLHRRWHICDITAETTDPDFAGRIHHQAWLIRRKRLENNAV
ncbi:MAG: class I SAM-dependent methyltransferase [bacterium]|nr:class I SAM-dependent methyltransferase [bacterium]